jgi:hypothetical protein
MRLFGMVPLSWAAEAFHRIRERPLRSKRRAIARREINFLIDLRAQLPKTAGSAAVFDEAIAAWTRQPAAVAQRP